MPCVQDRKTFEFLTALSAEARLLRWWACTVVPEMHHTAIKEIKKHPWPENTAFHYVWTTVENQCLVSFVNFVKQKPFKHLSLHFDGLMVDSVRCQQDDDFGKEASASIHNDVGISVSLVQKTNQTLFQKLKAARPQVSSVQDSSGALEYLMDAGLSVPLALAHITGDYEGMRGVHQTTPEPRMRTYREWFNSASQFQPEGEGTWLPRWGLQIPSSGPFLVHSESNGVPSCLAFTRNDDCSLRMFDGRHFALVSVEMLREQFQDCTDRGTIVTFAPERDPVQNPNVYILEDLRGV